MLALLIYCYADSIFSSRKIERATTRDITVKYLTGGHKYNMKRLHKKQYPISQFSP